MRSGQAEDENTLILSKIIKNEKIDVSNGYLDQHVRDMILAPNSTEAPDKKSVESIKASMGAQARERLLFKNTIDLVIDQATVTVNNYK